MTQTQQDWERLGELLVARRVELGFRRRAEFAREKGLNSDRVLFDIEKAKRTNYDPATYAFIEQLYAWHTGSIRRVLQGDPPIPLENSGARGHIEITGGSGQVQQPNVHVADHTLSVVPAIVEAMEDEDNEVLAAIRKDPNLDEIAREHFLSQYVILRDFSAFRRAGDPLPYAAHGRRTSPVDPAEEARIEAEARAAAEQNPHSPVAKKIHEKKPPTSGAE